MASRRRGSVSQKGPNTLAEAIIQDQTLFLNLCHAVKSSAERAITREVIQEANTVCLSPILDGVQRDLIPVCLKLDSKSAHAVQFNPAAMTFVGGAAVQLYNIALRDIIRHDFTRNTPDIDAVWWPEIRLPANIVNQVRSKATVMTDTTGRYAWAPQEHHVAFRASEYAVVSSSPAILSLVRSFERELKSSLDTFIEHYRHRLQEFVRTKTGRRTPATFEFTTAVDHHIKSGVWNVQANLHFHGQMLNLIEM